jgi:hypothetical protein
MLRLGRMIEEKMNYTAVVWQAVMRIAVTALVGISKWEKKLNEPGHLELPHKFGAEKWVLSCLEALDSLYEWNLFECSIVFQP